MSDSAASVYQVCEPARGARVSKLALLAVAGATLMLAACAQTGGMANLGDSASLTETSAAPKAGKPEAPKTELAKATEYWGKQSRDNPRDLKSAINYSKNLKASGQKGEALAVLQQAAMFHGQNRELASEYGRLALELDQVQVASQVLQVADDPSAPDWRVVSARGTVLAKQGKYSEAIPFYEKALQLSSNEPSVLNNLALAHTMGGEPGKAEQLLRQASAGDTPHAARIRQNLGLVLGVQGRHDEARQLASNGGDSDAQANAQTLAGMVKTQPGRGTITAGAQPGTAVGGWSTRVVPATPAKSR
jgi:Flp pilus assembly protein TadD